jgi:hypothetical protein
LLFNTERFGPGSAIYKGIESNKPSKGKKDGRNMTHRLAILSIFAAVSTANIYAQDGSMKAQVPFSFHIGQKTMPAGEYIVQPNRLGNGTVTFRSRVGKASAIIGTLPNSTLHPRVDGKLVFTLYNNGEYFLAEVWSPGSTAIAKLSKTKREREMAANAKETDQATLVAKRN